MSTEELIADAMSLPLAERVLLAQALWESIEADPPAAGQLHIIKEARRRSDELESGEVIGRTHEEVMQAARRSLE